MNKEDMLLLCNYLSEQTVLDDNMKKLKDKCLLIKKQIEAQDVIHEVQKELAEMDKVKE